MKKNEPLFIGEYDKSVILTYMGAAFALLAVYAIIQSQLRLAMMAFIVSGICDLFDGVVARRMKRTESQRRILTAWPSMMKDRALILSACP